MDLQNFKYEVAFSFLYKDETLATQLHDRIADRFKAFLYTKKQEEIAGSDGMEYYSNVFLNESRLNVLLYRKSWGDTPFTGIEMNAIKSRLFQGKNGGWKSLIIVNVDKSEMPSWVPPYYVYLDFESYGVERTIGAIEFTLESLGGVIVKEGLMDFAARQQRKIQFDKERQEYLGSAKAVAKANEEVQHIFSQVKSKWEMLKTNMSDLKIGKFEGERDHVVFNCGIYWLAFFWQHHSINSLIDSFLEIRIYSMPRFTESRYKEHARGKYKFAANEIMEVGWNDLDNKFSKSDELIDTWIKAILAMSNGEQDRC